MNTHFVFDDGGREAAGFRGQTGDCVVRSIAIAALIPYRKVYDELFDRSKHVKGHSRAARYARKNPSPRNGTHRKVYEPYLFELGFEWSPCMAIGSGCKVHLRPDELPSGRLVVAVSKHLTAVINGVIHDTYDPSRGGNRCVYGYYYPVVNHDQQFP